MKVRLRAHAVRQEGRERRDGKRGIEQSGEKEKRQVAKEKEEYKIGG